MSVRVLVITNMYPHPEQPALGTFVRDQVEAVRRKGVAVDVLFINGPKSKLNYVWGIFRLWWRLLGGEYDLIHAHYVFSGVIARLQPFLPVIVTYHGSELGVNSEHWLSILSRASQPFFQRVIVVSPEMRRKLNGSNVHLIPCGVDLDKFSPIPLDEARQQLGLPADKPLVVWVGDPRRRVKRHDMVVQAMELVKHRLPEAELVVVTGKPYPMVPIYMSACDVLALTSSREGSPMVIKEAMACNLPVVSVDVGDVASVVGGTEDCYLVAPTSSDVAEKLLLVLSDRRRTNGRDVIRHLDADIVAGQIVEVYREAIEA